MPSCRHRSAGGVYQASVGRRLDLLRKKPLPGRALICLVANHALREEPGERFVEIEVAALFQCPGEEPRVKEVEDRMLDPANILVDGHPIIDRLPLEGGGRARRAKAQEIPSRIKKRIQCVGLASRATAASRAEDVFPCRMTIERVARHLEADILRQDYRQVLLGHGDDAAGAAMDDRDRTAPITLARDPPIAQPIGGSALAATQHLEPLGGRVLRFGDQQTVEKVRVEQRAVFEIGGVVDCESCRVCAGRQHDRDHREAVFSRKFEVALVVRRAAENGARAVLHQHEIGDPDRDMTALVEGVHRI